MIYHFLTEVEHFSEFKGGAISRWVANVVREQMDTHVVCSSADNTWGFAPERIHIALGIRKYLKFRARRHYPPQISGPILRRLYEGDLPELKQGDVVWVHGVPALAEALLPLVKKAGAKLVFHLHSSAFVTHSSLVMKRIKRDASLVVFCSEFLHAEAHKKFSDLSNTAVLYNGADEKMFYPSPTKVERDIPVVLFASRLVPQKGAHVLLDAMRYLEERKISITAKIYGASFFGGSAVTPYMKKLQLNIPSNVEFCGYESGTALAQKFREADIFCLPATYNDPFPLATLEAMASGTSVVASRMGGIPEALAEGGGILVPASDAMALAEALQHLAENPHERDLMAQRGVHVFQQNFSWSIVQQRYQQLLKTIWLNKY